MSKTGLASFDTTVDKTNHVLRRIEEAYGWSKDQRNLSYHALRAVLHALRDRLTVDEAAQLAAQLPMLVRGIYFEGWDPSVVPVKLGRAEFLERVRRKFPDGTEDDMERLTRTVLTALREHITDGEWQDVRSSVPKDLAAVLP
ncbi:MAG TPA: DUF2267 domain-containing protein [Pseudonocardia sp.]|jgi:uncharacterized protein (DUF2267 family)